METELLNSFAQSNNWGLIWPEVSLALLALVILVLDIAFGKFTKSNLLTYITLGGLFTIFCVFAYQTSVNKPDFLVGFSGLLNFDRFSYLMRLFFLLAGLPVLYLGALWLEDKHLPRTEFFFLSLVALSGMMLLASSSHFLMLFVALETVTIAFYILVSYARYSHFSLEAGLKYIVMGGLSTALLLFGIVLLYGAAGDLSLPQSTADGLSFGALTEFIRSNADSVLVKVGAVLVLAGVSFKIGAVPFQVWVTDVYQGSPTPVTAFLAVASKAAGFAILVNLFKGPFQPLTSFMTPVLLTLACASILYGNIAATTQKNLKKVMGLSGISHAGYLLLGVIAVGQGIDWAYLSVWFYLITYLFAAFSIFTVMIHTAGYQDEYHTFENYRSLLKREPFVAVVMTISLASLAGIPPLAGFTSKFLVFVAAFKCDLWTGLIVAAVGVTISIYYYFGWIRAILFQEEIHGLADASHKPLRPISLEHKIVLGTMAFASVILGITQGGITV